MSADTAANKGGAVEAQATDALNTPIEASSQQVKTEPEISGPRRTPFHHPASSVSVPETSPLTTEQTTAYNSLLNTVSTWTSIAESSAANAPHADLTETELMWLTRECLLRYLRASKWVVTTAQTRLLNTLLWRRTYGIVSAHPEEKGPKITSDYVGIENETGKQWLLGYDNAGRPCQYLNPSRQNTKRSDRQIEHLVFMLERAIDITPAGQETLALLINFAETSSGQGATVSQGRQTISILQNHYPERLGRALLCNLPWHFWAFMKVITPFIDPVTRSKLVFNEPLQNHVPPEQLMKSHGGNLADFDYDHSQYWPALNKLADERRSNMHKRWVAGGKRVGESEFYLKGGTEVSLAKEEEGRLGREKGSLRGRTLQVASDQRREKSVSILAEGEEADKLDQAIEQEATKENHEPQSEAVEDKANLTEEMKALKVAENGSAANGSERAATTA